MARPRKKIKTKRVDRPKWWAILMNLVFGLVFTLSGLLCLVVFAQVNVLTCTRLEPSQPSCVLESRLLGVLPLNSTPLEGLRGARVADKISESTYEDSNGRTRTRQTKFYWIALITDEGEVDLDALTSGWIGQKQHTADRINAFVRDPGEKRLQAYSDLTSLFFIWAPLLFLTPGLYMLMGTAEEIKLKLFAL